MHGEVGVYVLPQDFPILVPGTDEDTETSCNAGQQSCDVSGWRSHQRHIISATA